MDEDGYAMKEGALIANAGHFRNEINVEALQGMATENAVMRENVHGYKTASDKWLYLIGDGNIVNIACADGHPAEIEYSDVENQLKASDVLEDSNKMDIETEESETVQI